MKVFRGGAFVVGALLVAGRPAGAVTIAEKTPVQIRLTQELKSGHERKGDQIEFELSNDLTGENGAVLVRKGTPVIGQVTRSNGRGMFGKPGRLEFTADYIRVSDQVRVPLRSTAMSGHGRNNAAAAITTAVLLAPIAIFVKGREVKFDRGQEFTVYVDQTTELAQTVVPQAPTGSQQAFTFDPKRASLFKLKTGLSFLGTICEVKEASYTVATELGVMTLQQDKIESITPQGSTQGSKQG